MKWCTTGGPVLHLGRCCGTPLCVGTCWKRSRTQGCGCYTLSTKTGGPSCYSFADRQTTICCNMESTGALWKAVRPPTPTSERRTLGILRAPSAQNRLRSTFSQHCAKCAATTRHGLVVSPRQKEKCRAHTKAMAHYFVLSIM